MFHSIGFHNSEFLPIDQIRITPTDLSIHRGYSIFDFFKMRNRTNPWIDLYLNRLFNSCSLAGLQLNYSKEEVESLVQTLLEKNQVADSNIKVIVSAGPSHNGYHKDGPAVLLLLSSHSVAPNPKFYSEGSSLITQVYRRDIPEIKTTNYLMSAKLADRMKAVEAADVLYHHEEVVTECSRCNLFIVKHGHLYTPKEHILKGITRERVLTESSMRQLCLEQNISLDEVISADEVFITSTTKGVMPVVKIDGNIIGNGQVGSTTSKLMQEINQF